MLLHGTFLLFPQLIEIRRQAAEHKAQRLLKELDEEITALKKRRTALNQLAMSEDYVHFLKVWMSRETQPKNCKKLCFTTMIQSCSSLLFLWSSN